MRTLCPRTRVWISTVLGISLFFCNFKGLAFAKGAGYQKASVPLTARIIRNVRLRLKPSAQSMVLQILKKGKQVRILGRKTPWFEVQVRTQKGKRKGWVHRNYVQILAPRSGSRPRPSTQQKTRIQPKDTSINAPSSSLKRKYRRSETGFRRRSFSPPSRPFRLIPAAGFAYGAKSIANQYRVGFDFLYNAWPKSEVGANLELGITNGTLVSAGPIFTHHLRWPQLGSIHTTLYGGFSFFYFLRSGSSDQFFGPRFGTHFRWSPGRTQGLNLVGKVGADILLFGGEVVALPITTQLGLALRF